MLVRPYKLLPGRDDGPPFVLTAGMLVVAKTRPPRREITVDGVTAITGGGCILVYGRVRSADARSCWVDLLADEIGTKIIQTRAYTLAEVRSGDVRPRPDRNLCASCAKVARGAYHDPEEPGRPRPFLCLDCRLPETVEGGADPSKRRKK